MNYYIADAHFGHQNIIELCQRPFENIETMANTIINNWNKKVKRNDNVYILGDMFYQCENPEEILKQLKGKKHLIIGNHDSFIKNEKIKKYFCSINHYLEITDGHNLLILCHYPLITYKHENHKNAFMVHGHIHLRNQTDLFNLLKKRPRILNAGVDINGFTPRSLEELVINNAKIKE